MLKNKIHIKTAILVYLDDVQRNQKGRYILETLGKKSVKTEYNSLGFESKSVAEVDRNAENEIVNSESAGAGKSEIHYLNRGLCDKK